MTDTKKHYNGDDDRYQHLHYSKYAAKMTLIGCIDGLIVLSTGFCLALHPFIAVGLLGVYTTVRILSENTTKRKDA